MNTVYQCVLCPICGSKTRLRIREDTMPENFPLHCPKCKHETLINIRQLNSSVIKEPDAKTQSPVTMRFCGPLVFA
ncbi:cysteine-rich KTR domain-containing protein [Eisenbergiella tayi]|uniref:cysteine-rich KTR domain-containing protein n=1 Tax=Eisenbergiella tayi TaxID=1432052 RepID=UPI003AB752DD